MNNLLIKQLAEGDFSNVKLNEWFEYIHEYSTYPALIATTIQGCSKQINTDMFLLIFMFTKKYYFKTKDSTSTDDIIINRYCEEFLKDLIIISSMQPQYKYIINDLAIFPNSIIRLYYCAYIDHHKFLEDNSPRIRKVANIINQFYNEIYEKYSYNQIEFITSAIKYGAIQMTTLSTPQKHDEFVCIQFKSALFNWNDSSTNPNLMNFDVDILHTIPDKKILASIILDWINEGRISFKEDMTPVCFERETTNQLKRTLKQNDQNTLTSEKNND